MDGWFRSMTLLGLGFTAAVVATLGLAAVIIPGRAASRAGNGAEPSASAVASVPSPTSNGGVPTIGGVLAVTGDRSGSFVLNRQPTDGNAGLVGDDGRISFDAQPVTVSQMSYDGLDFFPEPEDCSVTPGTVDEELGIGQADISCLDLADIRDTAVISINGTVGLPADLLVGRLTPETGGQVTVGDETWTFEFAYLYVVGLPSVAGTYEMQLFDEAHGILNFSYDPESEAIRLVGIATDGGEVDAIGGSCAMGERVLGHPNPDALTVELTIDCSDVEVPGMGQVAIKGTVVVDEVTVR